MPKVKIPMTHIEGTGSSDETPPKRTQTSQRPKKVRFEQAEAPDAASDRVDEPAPTPSQREQAASAARGPLAWLSRTFPGHEHAVFGGLVGLLVAVSVFVFGFWRTLFVAALVVVGVAVGQYLDGDARIVRVLRRIIALSPEDEDAAE